MSEPDMVVPASIPTTKSLSKIRVTFLVWIQGHNSRTEHECLVLKVAYCFLGYQIDAKKKQWTTTQRMVGFNNWAEIQGDLHFERMKCQGREIRSHTWEMS